MGLKKKTVKKVLIKKIGAYINSFEDNKLQRLLRKNIIISGGAITSLLMGKKPNDYDIYLKTEEACIAVSEYYIKKFKELNDEHRDIQVKKRVSENIYGEETESIGIFIKSDGIVEDDDDLEYEGMDGIVEDDDDLEYEGMDVFVENGETLEENLPEAEIIKQLTNDIVCLKEEKPDKNKKKELYRPRILTQNAITLSNKIQIIIRFFGEPDEIHKNFDFVHCTNYYDYNTHTLVTNLSAYESMLSKSLVYNGSLFPICSLFRLRKFLNRGWRCSAAQIIKIARQASFVDWSDVQQIKEQLIGVDSMYCLTLIQHLSNPTELKKFKEDSGYLIELIEKIYPE